MRHLARGRVIQTVWELKDRFTPGVEKAKKSTMQYRREVRDLKRAGAATFDNLKKGILAVGVASAGLVTSGFMMAKSFSNTADEIDKASMRAGVHAEYLQEMRYAMGQVGVSNDTLDRSLKRTNQRLGMAAAGNKKYSDALKEMGVAIHGVDGNMRSAEDVFDDAITKLSQLENAQDRARLAGEFFGVKTAQDLLPALEAGGAELEKMRKEARDFGMVISNDAVKAGADFSSAMDKLRGTTKGMMHTLGASALPVFTRGIEWLTDQLPKVKQFGVNAFESFTGAIDRTREKFYGARVALIEIKNSIFGAFGIGGEGGNAIEWFTDTAIPKVIGGIATVVEKSAEFYFFVKDNWSNISPIVYGIVGALTAYYGITKAVTIATYAQTAATWALGAAIKFATSPIGVITLAVGGLIAAGTFLIKNWDDVKLAGKKTWNGIVSVTEWGVNLVIKGVNTMVEGALSGINLVIRGINKIAGSDIKEIEFGIKTVDFGAAKFDTEGQSFNWRRNKEEERNFEEIIAQNEKQRTIKIEEQKSSNDRLIQSLDANTEMMAGTAGRVNDIHVTLYASDMTAEQIADELVPKIKRKLFAT